jgi:hypothetical protein
MPPEPFIQTQDVLFNFKWTRRRVEQLHQLSKHRGVTAAAIIKDYLIEQFKADGIDFDFEPANQKGLPT